GNVALADYLGISSTTPEQWAQLAVARGLPPELSEVSLFTPRAAAPVHDAKNAPTVVDRNRDAAKVERQRSVAPVSAFRERTQGWWGRR
ncbi:MAG: hypothetical protein Q7J32_14195, partial [Sphingomonadaceae bacterium]|nr:hypothetical protein [Sphingomonadaceae bacterium]